MWKKEGTFSSKIFKGLKDTFEIVVVIKNGDYIDDGVLRVEMRNVSKKGWSTIRNDFEVEGFLEKTKKKEEVHLYEEKIFQTLSRDSKNLTK